MRHSLLACHLIAAGQEGLVEREQALAKGCALRSLQRHQTAGDLIEVLPGVYRMPGFPQTVRQQLWAACLWGGPGTGASHQSAAALLKLPGFRLDAVHVVTTKRACRLPTAIHVHRVAQALPGTRPISGIPVIPPWITLVHLATCTDEVRLGRALDDALYRGLVSLSQMRWAVEKFAGPGKPGTRLMRWLLDERSSAYQPPESELEAAFYAVVDASHLPAATRQARVSQKGKDLRLDLLWEDQGLIVEVDGWASHGTREAFQADRARDRTMVIAGRATMRFTWDDVVQRPKEVIEDIREALHRRGLDQKRQ